MISIRKHLERLSGEEHVRKAFLGMVDSFLTITRKRVPVADAEEHAWFCASLENLQARLQEDPSPTNVEVVSALLNKTLEDHWVKLSQQTKHREEELKRIISLLAESAAQLDGEHKAFYLSLRKTVQNFQSISQMEDVTYMRKKLSEQVSHLQETVHRHETASGDAVARLRHELDEAHKQIATLMQATSEDQLTRLPARAQGEKKMLDLIEAGEGFCVAMAVIERLDLINLRYGPEYGDDVLRKFAKRVRELLPKRVFLCRWGGPAFVAFVDQLTAGEVRAMFDRTLDTIAAEPLEVHIRGGGMVHITARFAVHSWTEIQTPERVIRIVDGFCFSPNLPHEQDGKPELA